MTLLLLWHRIQVKSLHNAGSLTGWSYRDEISISTLVPTFHVATTFHHVYQNPGNRSIIPPALYKEAHFLALPYRLDSGFRATLRTKLGLPGLFGAADGACHVAANSMFPLKHRRDLVQVNYGWYIPLDRSVGAALLLVVEQPNHRRSTDGQTTASKEMRFGFLCTFGSFPGKSMRDGSSFPLRFHSKQPAGGVPFGLETGYIALCVVSGTPWRCNNPNEIKVCQGGMQKFAVKLPGDGTALGFNWLEKGFYWES